MITASLQQSETDMLSKFQLSEEQRRRHIERFLRYVRIDTQADETSDSTPSTKKQLDLSRLLALECTELGLENVSCSPAGIVTAHLPSRVSGNAPAIVWNSHVDTSPDFAAGPVKPIIHEDYQGGDIILPGDPSRIITEADNPALHDLHGATLITSDGTTLLGGDDKCGIAIIMTAAEILLNNKDIPHGPIRIVFTTDEEIGRGLDELDVSKLEAVCGYTVDGGGDIGGIDCETFSADGATVTVRGNNIHPSIGYGKLINAVKILAEFLTHLPPESLSPETTQDREGFVHPNTITGGVAEASCSLILRDFETQKLAQHADLLKKIAADVQAKYPGCEITVTTREQYRNMRDGLVKEPRAVDLAEQAIRNVGLTPNRNIIRGGTDGSLMTAQGLPTPNLNSGQHNPHAPVEWTSVEEMEVAVGVLLELAQLWGKEST